MSDPRKDREVAEPHDPQTLIVRHLESEITPAEFAALNEMLRTRADVRAMYRDLIDRSAAIRSTLRAADKPAETKEPNEAPARPLSAAGVPMYRKGYEPQPFKLRPHHYALIAATLLAACGLAAYLLTTSVDPEPSPPEPSSPPPVATLIQNTGNLRTPHGYPAEGDDYGRGEYTLSAGTAEFMLTNAVNVKLRGNTRMFMRNAMNVSLTRGSAAFVCPKDAKGFTVHLPDKTRIVDLGTAFRVDVGDAGQTTLHVSEGLVRLERTAGESIEIDPSRYAVVKPDHTDIYRHVIAVDLGKGGDACEPGFQPIKPRAGATVEVDGVVLSLFNKLEQRDRGPDTSPLLRDFALRSGKTQAGSIGVRLVGLGPGKYRIRSWHFDADFPDQKREFSLKHRVATTSGDETEVIDLSADSIGSEHAEFIITVSDSEADHEQELLFREVSPGTHTRLNAFRIDYLERTVHTATVSP